MMTTFTKMRWVLPGVLVTIRCSLEDALGILLNKSKRPAGHALQSGPVACVGRSSSPALLPSVEVR